MGGLRYETGRDMPPGMQELAAVKIAQQLTETAPVAESEPMEHTCVCCGRGTNNTEQIGNLTIHFCDSCQEKIRREVAWQDQGHSHGARTVKCPYCGYEMDKFGLDRLEDGENPEQECALCHRLFDVDSYVVRVYSVERSVCEMPEDWQPPEE